MKVKGPQRLMLVGLLMALFLMPIVGSAEEFDPFTSDADNDGLSYWDEVNRYYSDPNNRDTDGDFIDDGREVRTGTSPIDDDSDGDLLSDRFEYNSWNPESPNLFDKYYRCPYIADLPNITVSVEENRILRRYTFQKHNETRNVTLSNHFNGVTIEGDHNFNRGGGVDIWGQLTKKLGWQINAPTAANGIVGSASPFFSLVAEAGIRGDLWGKWIWNDKTTTIGAGSFRNEDRDTYTNYTSENWDCTAATILLNVSITNAFDRVVCLDKIIFDLIVGDTVFRSEEWTPSGGYVLGAGEHKTIAVPFRVDGEDWVKQIVENSILLEIATNAVEISLREENSHRFYNVKEMTERVRTMCAAINIVNSPAGTVRYFVTANVDKIDGLSALEALDRLFIPYEYQYDHLTSLMGVESKPGEQVWGFLYQHIWHNSDTLSNETNFEDLRMWGRGDLFITLLTDSDGDWLSDDIETEMLGTNPNEPDSDFDYLDDYMEVSVAHSQPWNPDSDGGGTLDGIEYYSGTDANDPLDDGFNLPDWYTDHETILTAQSAADVLLERALHPAPSQLTWPVPQSATSMTTYGWPGPIAHSFNETIGPLGETVLCMDVGDVDSDADNEIVVGTYPSGMIYLVDNETGVWEAQEILNMTDVYGTKPIKVWDLAIGNITGSLGNNKIVFGTWYYDAGDKGGAYYIDVNDIGGPPVQIGPAVPGGVYSVAIGEVDNSVEDKPEVVIGQGGSDVLGDGRVIIYNYDIAGFVNLHEFATNSSKVYVHVDAFGDDFEQTIVFCSNALNSTLGYIQYEDGTGWQNTVIKQNLVFAGDIPPYEKFMCVGIGDMDQDPLNEIIVAVDRTGSSESDYLMLYSGYNANRTIAEGLTFGCPQILVSDIDNDNADEIAFHDQNINNPITSNMSLCKQVGGSTWPIILIEELNHLDVFALASGDHDSDDVIDFYYSETGHGNLKHWSHPEGGLWSGESFSWDIEISHLSSWIYLGDEFPVNVTLDNGGPLTITDAEIELTPANEPWFIELLAESHETIIPGASVTSSFALQPLTSGNHSLRVWVNFGDPVLLYSFRIPVLVQPRLTDSARIGSALLNLGELTGNMTLVDAAVDVGNWLQSVRIPIGDYSAWNGDNGITETLYPGCITATASVGQFLLDLYRNTGTVSFLIYAISGARFLVESGVVLWGQYKNLVAEIAEVGSFLYSINQELKYDYFDDALTDIIDYLLFIADVDAGQETANWYDDCGLTQAACMLFQELRDWPTAYLAEWAANWLSTRINDNAWLSTKSLSFRDENPYSYYQGTGLAGMGIALVETNLTTSSDYTEEITDIADRIVSEAYLLAEGTNWQETSWTMDVSDLVSSMSWDYGTSGISAFLANAYRITANQTYLDYAIDTSQWIDSCLDVLDPPSSETEVISGALADAIQSMVAVHSIMPVVVAGYFVDPMVSYAEETFILSGYVQTLGYHAKGIDLEVVLSSMIDLGSGETATISIGDLDSPGVAIVNWELKPLDYGFFEIAVFGNSSNAGSSWSNSTVEVTDVGVSEVEGLESRLTMLFVPQDIQDTVYNVGEAVFLPIQVEYVDGSPAYNASVKVGDFGTAVVNDTGYANIVFTSYDPGTFEIPIYIRYDKKTGITASINNITISVTFSSLELVDVQVSSLTGATGLPVTFSGSVRYSHDQSIAAGAFIDFNGLFNVTADDNGSFSFTHTEGIPGTINYTIRVISDASGDIYVSSHDVMIQVIWEPFWTPLMISLAIGGTAVVVVVLVVGRRFMQKRRGETSAG